MRWPWKKPRGPGLGYTPNPDDSADRDFNQMHLGGMADRSPGRFEVPGGQRKQGSTNSCVGQAIERLIVTLEHSVGLPYMPRSALAMYALALQQFIKPPNKLRDEGCYPRSAYNAIRHIGAPLEATRPFTEDQRVVLSRVDFDELVSGHDSRWLEYFWIFDEDPTHALRAAFGAKHPATVGLDVTDSFTTDGFNGKLIVDDLKGNRRGGHYLMLGGEYYDGGQQSVGAWCLNSWANWGMGGWCVLTWDLLKAEGMDIAVATGWERLGKVVGA